MCVNGLTRSLCSDVSKEEEKGIEGKHVKLPRSSKWLYKFDFPWTSAWKLVTSERKILLNGSTLNTVNLYLYSNKSFIRDGDTDNGLRTLLLIRCSPFRCLQSQKKRNKPKNIKYLLEKNACQLNNLEAHNEKFRGRQRKERKVGCWLAEQLLKNEQKRKHEKLSKNFSTSTRGE